MKIDAMRKSLEEQVKQLQVQIQEAEAAALLGGKRVISKLEVSSQLSTQAALYSESRSYSAAKLLSVRTIWKSRAQIVGT